MELNLSQNGLYALALARRGYRVLACCWPDAQGRCACGWGHGSNPKQVGKAPRVRSGVNAATTTAQTLRYWWGETPQANVAIALAPDYIMLDPDSADARAECYKHGVPDTLTRISRNKAFIFTAPTGIGRVQLTHKGESGAIDILNGYCVVFGAHRTGDRIFLENPLITPAPCPKWMLDWIERYRTEARPVPELDPGAPPVRLDAEELQWWTGRKTVQSSDGEVDRSATLFTIGIVLARANASVEAIAEALAERDATLGYGKYSERQDGPLRYREIAAHVMEKRTANQRPKARPGRPSDYIRREVVR